ncbi:MAG: acetamidase/formamidase family protein [Steroidobacteraceae bacterium]
MSSKSLTPHQVPLGKLPDPSGKSHHWYVPASDRTVHWGYFSKQLQPVVEIASGDYVTLECLTHQAGDDPARMIQGDPGAESVYHWTREQKNVRRRGAGPMDAANGAGGGQGVHILTGPVRVQGAAPGDVLEVRILAMQPRACANAAFRGSAFGTNLAAHWGYHYHDLLEEPKPREVVTIYELDAAGGRDYARPLYNYRWGPCTDPDGIVHRIYDYPGLVVDPEKFSPRRGVLPHVRVPIRPHFGVLGLAPAEADMVSSIPPNYTGGNVDDWRIGKGATLYYPVAVDGALLSAGDTHAAQGDSELCGTAIESSWTGVFQIILHKQRDIGPRSHLAQVQGPLLETAEQWVVHGFSYPRYLTDLGDDAQQQVFQKASVDLAMRDAFRKIRNFLMQVHSLGEDEAISLISVAVDFGVTQVVDGNWGVHASLSKRIFDGGS